MRQRTHGPGSHLLNYGPVEVSKTRTVPSPLPVASVFSLTGDQAIDQTWPRQPMSSHSCVPVDTCTTRTEKPWVPNASCAEEKRAAIQSPVFSSEKCSSQNPPGLCDVETTPAQQQWWPGRKETPGPWCAIRRQTPIRSGGGGPGAQSPR